VTTLHTKQAKAGSLTSQRWEV